MSSSRLAAIYQYRCERLGFGSHAQPLYSVPCWSVRPVCPLEARRRRSNRALRPTRKGRLEASGESGTREAEHPPCLPHSSKTTSSLDEGFSLEDHNFCRESENTLTSFRSRSFPCIWTESRRPWQYL